LIPKAELETASVHLMPRENPVCGADREFSAGHGIRRTDAELE